MDLPFDKIAFSDLAPDELAAQIRYHSDLYYNLGRPVVSDAEFDRLVERLRQLAPGHPVLEEVGAQSAEASIVLDPPMLSLEKCNTPDEFEFWAEGIWADRTGETRASRIRVRSGAVAESKAIAMRIDAKDKFRQWLAQTAFVATPKIDGLACNLEYNDAGTLVRAVTRGDGRHGEDITHNAKEIIDIPQRLKASGSALQVRGEIFLSLAAFSEVADNFSSPRNLAAGTVKAKNPTMLSPSKLQFRAYDLIGIAVRSETEKFRELDKLGFVTPASIQCGGRQAQMVYDQWARERHQWPFEADGVVFRLDAMELQRWLQTTAHHPRSAIAWKFPADSGTSTLQEVEWSVSRTGTITPVAIVAPVVLSGASVSRATLHNVSNLRRLGLKIGDVVELVRRGGVIPHLERSLGGGSEVIDPPAECPSCGAPAVEQTSVRIVAGEETRTVVLACSQPARCSVARHRQILHYAATLEIEGLGEKVLDLLLEYGLIRDAADLYTLQAGDLLALPSFGELKTSNLLKQIDKARRVRLPDFLVALGIDSLGKHAANLLGSRWSLSELRNCRVSDIATLHSVRGVTAQRICAGLADASELIDRLLAYVTVVASETQVSGPGPLSGQVVVFTGTLTRMGRRAAQQQVLKLGGLTGDSVTTETTLLVVGADELDEARASAKLKKARKLQEAGGAIEILPEAAFWQRVEP